MTFSPWSSFITIFMYVDANFKINGHSADLLELGGRHKLQGPKWRDRPYVWYFCVGLWPKLLAPSLVSCTLSSTPVSDHFSSNIDRLLAVWQILNPKKWFHPSDRLNGDTPLQPFHVDVSSNTWTSDLCKYTRDLNYTYDDLAFPPKPELSGTVEDEYLAKLRKHINSLYGTTRKALLNDGIDTEGNKNDYLINIVYDR